MEMINEEKIIELQKLLVPNRINILSLLDIKDTCVCEMVKVLKLKHNLVSHHLKTLVESGYLDTTRNGQHIIYGIKESKKEIVHKLLLFIKK